MPESCDPHAERRRFPRGVPFDEMRVSRSIPVLPLSETRVLNVSKLGVAIQTTTPVREGERLSFTVYEGMPPVLAEVLGVEPNEKGYHVRCRCILGAFENIDTTTLGHLYEDAA